MRLWRISDFDDLSGIGGELIGGRWHSVGQRIVYSAGSSALAMLEVMAGFRGRIPVDFQLLRVEGPHDADVATFDYAVPADPARSRTWGDAWLAGERTALARVPSAIAPYSFNWLLNPAHPGAELFRVVAKSRWPWDRRLFS